VQLGKWIEEPRGDVRGASCSRKCMQSSSARGRHSTPWSIPDPLEIPGKMIRNSNGVARRRYPRLAWRRSVSRLSIEVFKYLAGAAGTPVNLCTLWRSCTTFSVCVLPVHTWWYTTAMSHLVRCARRPDIEMREREREKGRLSIRSEK